MGSHQNEIRPSQQLNAGAAEQLLIRLVGNIPPYSPHALSLAILCLISGLAVQIGFRSFGASLLFSSYFPAVLVAGLLAGLPAGVFVTIASSLIVWWAFLYPQFGFFPRPLDIAAFILCSGCILAVTERYRSALLRLRQHEQERELVMKELEHRGRNTYAVIDAIVQKTLGREPELANVLSGRIRAVKYANDLLNQTSTHSVLLKTLLLYEFVPHGEGRFHAEGPEVELAPDTARHLALAFHELVTNAVKYGALSNPGGRVLILWKDVNGVIRLEWREEGGPVVSPPKANGFGGRMVTQSLKSISDSITPTFAPEGLHCSITFRA